MPDKYRPSIKDHFYPYQLELGIGVNEQEMRAFAKAVKLNYRKSEDYLVHTIKAYCTKHCEMPECRSTIKYCRLAYPEARYGFCILCSYDLSIFNLDEFDRPVFLLEKLWQDAGLDKKVMWHISATNSRAKYTEEVKLCLSSFYSVADYSLLQALGGAGEWTNVGINSGRWWR